MACVTGVSVGTFSDPNFREVKEKETRRKRLLRRLEVSLFLYLSQFLILEVPFQQCTAIYECKQERRLNESVQTTFTRSPQNI